MRDSSAPDDTPPPLALEGVLVAAPADRVRIVVEPHCFDLNPEDVIDVEELPPPPGLVTVHGCAARLSLVAGARLLGVTPAAPYRDKLWRGREPFSLMTRSVQRVVVGDERFRRLEAEFYRAAGLAEDT